ncbi:ribonucleoside triphosphate reductase [Cavenderia fasciculata]|uniref:ribonucleoside-triphosphate reductase (thioredoxin) n=1 Tax=Cavenderia fasciculata TaxID=261658 RepID=F4QBK1_CACFS|nr:ribonucleoside triphosphate reductase [Cavenderia fasciculata]EGG14973.1 ribonucleoside triphosphate reductase [Cavenderia fasciculata]|eukprot:XP_004351489.1 ribonucleoside triphosphate reductase [Cavenderia fasciculata]
MNNKLSILKGSYIRVLTQNSNKLLNHHHSRSSNYFYLTKRFPTTTTTTTSTNINTLFNLSHQTTTTLTSTFNTTLMNYKTSMFTTTTTLKSHINESPAVSLSFSEELQQQQQQQQQPHQTPFYESRSARKFQLSKQFIDGYSQKQVPFGFGVLGELVYRRTYSRIKPDTGTNEQWYETVERVVNGTYNMQKQWIEKHGLDWNTSKAQQSAQKMYDKIFTMKFLPPGRGLWAMGSPLTEERGLYASLNNCAFVSTDNIKQFPSKPFIFLMDASMLGVGVGFDTKGAGTLIVKGPKLDKTNSFKIPDSREGWVESVRLTLDSYFLNKPKQVFDYSLIRGEGVPIKGFGGYSSGPESLKLLHHSICETLDKSIGKPITVTNIVDLMNLIGKCVVSGNTRQTAEIAFGDPESQEYINLKNYKVNPHRQEFGWTSNNSVFSKLGMDYQSICERIVDNGEPGFAWLENMQQFSRMDSTVGDWKDKRAMGGNPCLEQTLESFELCCLVETFPNNHTDFEDFKETLKYAFLYAKTVTLGRTQWPDTNKVLLRNRRIGCSMSGIAQFITNRGLNQLKQWCTDGYEMIQEHDRAYSEWLAIPKSIKTTSIKPSGTVSLLAGATPGMHYPISEYYIRRVRLPRSSSLLDSLREAGYHIEPAVDNKFNVVVEIPIHSGANIRKAKSLTMWEQLSLASFLQKYWADNQVSCTVTFDPKLEGHQLPFALDYFQYQLKGVSFLPSMSDEMIYEQMPYEEIDAQTYLKRAANLKPVDFNKYQREAIEPKPDKFCDSSSCIISSNTTLPRSLQVEPENL